MVFFFDIIILVLLKFLSFELHAKSGSRIANSLKWVERVFHAFTTLFQRRAYAIFCGGSTTQTTKITEKYSGNSIFHNMCRAYTRFSCGTSLTTKSILYDIISWSMKFSLFSTLSYTGYTFVTVYYNCNSENLMFAYV